MIITIHTDGASRGNPGVGGLGVVLAYNNVILKFKKYLGETTNNKAEYCALIFALERTQELIRENRLEVEKIICYSDSELLVKQMQRKYKVKNLELTKLFVGAWNIANQLPGVEYKHIPRELNKKADKLANEAIDKN